MIRCAVCNHTDENAGEEFINVIVGRKLGGWNGDALDIAAEYNKGSTYVTSIVACPKCGTIKLEDINLPSEQ